MARRPGPRRAQGRRRGLSGSPGGHARAERVRATGRGVPRARTAASTASSGGPSSSTRCRNNFQHIGLIRLILPKAKIIDARRHPMAAGFSAFKQHFARGQAFSYDLADIGRYYRDYVSPDGALRRCPAGRDPPGDLRGPGRRHRARGAATARLLRACPSSRRACGSGRTIARCGPPAPNRFAGRSSARVWSNGATTSPGSAPLKEALGPALQDLAGLN